MLVTSHAALQLNTSVTEQLHVLESHFLARRKLIEGWFHSQWEQTMPPVYGSIDLRNSGFKLAPIDMNLFPAGFNNLNPDFLNYSVSAAHAIIQKAVPGAKKILLIPESHTRNLRYWSNIKILQDILIKAGFQVRFGILSAEITAPHEIVLESGGKVLVEPLRRKDNALCLDQYEPDIVLLNNDLSDGIPEILQNLQQAVVPPAQLGWSQRFKSEHFQYYALVAAEFAELVNIDPWLISPLFRYCGEIDFMQQEGMECLGANAEVLFAEIQKKYNEYRIPHQPFLIIKADAGTYGMAVMTVRDANELGSLNRKQRTRMSMTKGGQPVRRVIIQEGVYTFETFGPDKAVAEPVIYLWGSQVVGGFYRVHQNRGIDENLNSPGMKFEPLAFAQTCHEPREDMDPDACPNRFYTYGIVAKLSMLAAAREIKGLRQAGNG
ncbi:hypothetical protein AQUSIP_03600 [Aquicella siphonis]|uniref:Glutamate--cysteine ligase n=2 Tax=Aquicella siphonis TaxID=254247 RepID=A0A5E4PE40_9COXI|nr:hypothetical protein AQUSIP_03600 [Aquicella siphonis]